MVLPAHIEPMLARIGQPFDSPAHLFEPKWDGVRAIAYVERGALRIHGRRRRDLATRYPELGVLQRLPPGTIVDGELVVLLPDGRPDFRAVLSRENASPGRVAQVARQKPVVFVVFDLLWDAGREWLGQPLAARRDRLGERVAAIADPRLVVADGIVGQGLALFEAVRARQLEGIVAKRLDAPYLPGQRTDAWQKIKPQQAVHCLVLGYEPDGERDFKSLIVATDLDGELRCVGKVGSGIGEAQRRELRERLFARPAKAPLIDVGMSGRWIEPGLFVLVSYLERTANGNLRAPVYKGLVS